MSRSLMPRRIQAPSWRDPAWVALGLLILGAGGLLAAAPPPLNLTLAWVALAASLCLRLGRSSSLCPQAMRSALPTARESGEPDAGLLGGAGDPLTEARLLIAGAWRLAPQGELRLPTGAWEMGVALHPGPVRPENQDHAVVFQIDQTRVALLADGCGGIPLGRQAAVTAVRGAASSIIRQLAWRSGVPAPPALEQVAQQAVQDASAAIAKQATCLGVDAANTMRCTLIVVLLSPQGLFYAHLGDGGGFIRRGADGRIESFVQPQKAGALNILSASLGAVIEGAPRHGRLEHRRGDLIWLCSDGLADRADPRALGDALLEAAVHHGGDLHAVAQTFLDRCAAYRDEEGVVFDDNMALILLAGAEPREPAAVATPLPAPPVMMAAE